MKLSDAIALHINDSTVLRVYKGEELVWEHTPPTPGVCTIALTGDFAGLIGGQPMTISGQTASFIQTDPAQVFAASSNPESPFPPPESGNVSFEVTISVTGNQHMSGGLLDEEMGAIAGVTCSSSGVSVVIGSDLSIPVTGNTVGFVLKSNGDVEAYDETGLVVSVSGAYTAPGMFVFINSANAGIGETGSVQVKTAGADFTLTTYPSGTKDWCGNEIPAPPTNPFAYPLNASEAFIASVSPPGFQDKMDHSPDEQTGIFKLEFNNTNRAGVLIGQLSQESPTVIPKFLQDLSFGQGSFAWEIHTHWPETNAALSAVLGFAGIQFVNLTPGPFLQTGTFSPFNIPANYVDVMTCLLSDVTEGENVGKKLTAWKNGQIHLEAMVADIQPADGLDLSQLAVFMYIEEKAETTADQGKFVDAEPTITCRFVTDPSEMQYLALLPSGTKDVVSGTVIVT